MAPSVLCVNLGLVIAGVFRHGGFKDGFATLVTGDAAHVTALSTGCHVLINVLSTILLGASNYTMQVLSAPTRDDLNAAHDKFDWLEIGTLSPRNIWKFPIRRKVLWMILGFSSVPLHLL